MSGNTNKIFAVGIIARYYYRLCKLFDRNIFLQAFVSTLLLEKKFAVCYNNI